MYIKIAVYSVLTVQKTATHEITQSLLSVCGVWFTSMVRLATKHKL